MLPDYVVNTLLLVVLVGAGAGIGGTAAAWLVARRRFPGSRVFDWALLLPLAMPAYVMAYAYTDCAAVRRARADRAARSLRLVARRLLVPRRPLAAGGAAAMFVFALYPYVYLLARTAFLERPPALIEAARTLGLDRRRSVLARGAAAGAARRSPAASRWR